MLGRVLDRVEVVDCVGCRFIPALAGNISQSTPPGPKSNYLLNRYALGVTLLFSDFPMNTQFTFIHLFGLIFILALTIKIIGGVLFWVLSYILGNKLADLLEESNPPIHWRRPLRPGNNRTRKHTHAQLDPNHTNHLKHASHSQDESS